MARERNQLRATFDGAAELYERARPGYPATLFDDLAELTGLHPDARALEVGCGTGKATRPLAERGYRVVAVELGPALADVARRVLAPFPRVEVVTAAFETWPPRRADFDLVFSATAWHWIDPSVRYPRAAELLRPGGWLGIASTEHVMPEDGGDPFFVAIHAVYEEIGETHGDSVPSPPGAVPDPLSAEIAASGLFAPPLVRRYVWEQAYTAEQYLELLGTYSGHIAMEPAKREHLFGEVRRLLAHRPDGLLRKHYMNWLHCAQLLGP